MRHLTTLLVALAVLWIGDAQAGERRDLGKIKNNPIEIEGGASPRMSVTFTHKSHQNKGFNCKHCHHESIAKTPFSSCREDCHAAPGPRERDPMSMFMAFHSTSTDRSCYGCHTSLAEKHPEKYPQFTGCRPCHMSPGARAIVNAANAAQARK